MGISTLYTIGISGVRAQRLAIDVTGQNIANVNTEGYSRQRVILKETVPGSVGDMYIGGGVTVDAIQRSYDRLIQRQLVDGGSSLAEARVEESALQRIEPLFNELGSDGLGKAINDFFNAWQDLSLNPTGAAERQSVYLRAQIMTDAFHQTSGGLAATASIANDSLTDITGTISDIAANIARLNEMIVSSEQLGNGSANELRDQRDLALRQLSEKVGITTYEHADGSVDVTVAGHELVVGNTYASLYNLPKGSAAPASIYITPLGNPPSQSGGVSPDILLYSQAGVSAGTNLLPYTGELGGTLKVRDVIVPDLTGKLDAIAQQIVTAVNTAHTAGFFFDSLGTPQAGGNFFDPLQLTAAGIRLSPTLTPQTIAAAAPPGSLVPGNNANAVTIAGLKESAVGNAYTSLVSEIGVRTANAESVVRTNESFMLQMKNLRESTSGVSLDEELTNLVKYQRAFEGSAKLINVATEMLDTILGLIR